ncbi:MAG TPA: sigma 54 modulation/S30EA ribosomal C-terminal domain-containing protein [Acidimicrobiales bacterium]|nr:sigma 54 modulation/S30EA ribosomal C-terminal domain-containing protein [Acidimicrobiales bacterium]
MAKPHDICDIDLLTHGDVESKDRDSALTKIRHLCELGHEPVLAAVVKLKIRKSKSELPAIAEASLNINGTLIRAHAAGWSMREAIDLLAEKLSRRLRRRRKRFENRRRQTLSRLRRQTDHENVHHEISSEERGQLPGYSKVPIDEREVVRHKSLAMRPVSLEEAADEMDQLDHGFYLFFDCDHNIDRVVYRNGGGKLYAIPKINEENLPGDTRPPILLSPLVLNHLPLTEAKALLNAGEEPFVFFTDSPSGRGQILYRRFDGHYGLITPAN